MTSTTQQAAHKLRAFTMPTKQSPDSLAQLPAYYQEHGYAVVRQVFQSEEIKAAQEATERLRIGIEAGELTSNGNFVCIVDPNSHTARANYWGSHQEPALEFIRTAPRLLNILEPLIGNSIKQLTNHLHWKAPHSPVTINFHTDRANRKPEYNFRNLETAFVQCATAIDPMTPDNGPLMVVPGSHMNRNELLNKNRNYSTGQPSRDILATRGYSEDDLLTILAEPGDFVMWHPDTIHGSDLNTSDINRCIYINGYIRASDTICGHWAFMNGKSVELPPKNIPTATSINSFYEEWQDLFPQ